MTHFKFSIEELRKTSPDIENVTVTKEYPGINGWVVHLCFANNQCADLSVDQGNANDADMQVFTKDAIVRQLEHHEKMKQLKTSGGEHNG